MNVWACGYCGSVNTTKTMKCVYCNAPKPKTEASASETWTRRTWFRDRRKLVAMREAAEEQ